MKVGKRIVWKEADMTFSGVIREVINISPTSDPSYILKIELDHGKKIDRGIGTFDKFVVISKFYRDGKLHSYSESSVQTCEQAEHLVNIPPKELEGSLDMCIKTFKLVRIDRTEKQLMEKKFICGGIKYGNKKD